MMQPTFSPARSAGDYVATEQRRVAQVSMMVYRSRAVVPPSDGELDFMVRQAQNRNHAESITGLLIYDQGYFYQWLEGPSQSVTRVWESIRADPRHYQVEVLREQSIAKRHFGHWNMRLARRANKISRIVARGGTTVDAAGRLPLAAPIGGWDQILTQVVFPQLKMVHSVDSPSQLDTASALLWHPHLGTVGELAKLLRAVDSGAVSQFIKSLVDEGASLEALYQEVFEPAARFLGGLWYADQCDDIDVTLSLGRLQYEARRLGDQFHSSPCAPRPGHAVLVAPQPGESHMLGAGMASELFWRAGWEVSCEFPDTDSDLRELVHERWFDVLDLSLSSALRHDHHLQAMGDTIRAAHAASLNPQLAVIVDGRTPGDGPGDALGQSLRMNQPATAD